MSRLLSILLVLSALAFGERATNFNGYIDTVAMPACSAAVLVYSTSNWCMTDFNAIRVILMVDDTSTAGFASDSIKVRWGYQSFSPCYNSSGVLDTCYSPRVVVDTMQTCSLGVMVVGKLDDNSIAYAVKQQADTISCTGYAVQSRAIFPEWDVYFRLWAGGITGNNTNCPLKIRMVNIRRLYDGVRQK